MRFLGYCLASLGLGLCALLEYRSVQKAADESNKSARPEEEEAEDPLSFLTADERGLLNAINCGDYEKARALLAFGVDPNMELLGNTLLHLTVALEIDCETENPVPSTTFVGELLAAGANPFIVNGLGTPLDVAAGTGNRPENYSHPLAYAILRDWMEAEIAREQPGG